METIEMWMDINGFEGIYQISNSGKVKSLSRIVDAHWKFVTKEKILSPSRVGRKRNYLAVCLSKNGKSYNRKIHRLVGQHFIANPLKKPEINHKNGDTFCNWSWNLEWATTRENIEHSWDNKLTKAHPKVHYQKLGISNRARFSIKIIHLPTDSTYASIKEAVAKTSSSLGSISRHINNKTKNPIWKRAF